MAPTPIQGTVIVVEDEVGIQKLVAGALGRAGYNVTLASDGVEALKLVAEGIPDLILADVMMPRMDGHELVRCLRAAPATRALPVIFLTGKAATEDVVIGLDLGADDYLPKPFRLAELLARVRAKIERPSLPRSDLPRDRQTGLLSESLFSQETGREITRSRRRGAPGCLAYLALDEVARLRERFGARVEAEIAWQVAELIHADAGRLELAGRDAHGRFTMLLPEMSGDAAQKRLERLSQRIAAEVFTACSRARGPAPATRLLFPREPCAGPTPPARAPERVRLTPTIGFAAIAADVPAAGLHARALLALHRAAAQLDLHPVRYEPSMERQRTARSTQRTAEAEAGHFAKRRADAFVGLCAGRCVLGTAVRGPLQVAMTGLIGLVLPFFLYAALGAVGLNITPALYLVLVLGLLGTALLLGIEGCLALRRVDPPEAPGPGTGPHDAPSVPAVTVRGPHPAYPTASAIIAAYLPNEAATVVETVEAFLRVEYPGPLQVILAYNTPRDLPVEATLREIARRDRRFMPLRVPGSTSKAQNVNAALAEVRGEFVGLFDADHHPDPDSFSRAWRWLSNGYDVVQGHCLVRNGDASWVARMVAVEFETIYAVSHPGRARLHGFGIFGGSNGYWKTDLLRRTRMHGFMLTEDIDSSMRVVAAGHRIASDPYLISRELAPVTLRALWHQRLRWAQGWLQVSCKHLGPGLRSPHLSWREKLGLLHLLGWREIFPWLSLQIVPILGYWAWWRGDRVNWLVPIFLFTMLVTLSSGPGQILFARRLAAPEIRRRGGWFLFYAVASFLFYAEFKNLISRVAHIKEAMRERQWKVTPRARAMGVRGEAIPD
jgi:CheY-like chemotaxis protein/cellulose synthase/poly-beta-1,6-N-acetylglucosamine synthase-like glycosyltransferase